MTRSRRSTTDSEVEIVITGQPTIRGSAASASQLAALVDGSSDAIILTDLRGIVRSANPAVLAVYGYRPDEIIGRNISLLVPGDLRDELTTVMATIIDGGSHLAVTTRRRCKDASIIDVSVRLSAVRDDDGAVIGVSGISRDVTAETRTRSLLEASEARYRAIAETAQEGIWTIGMDGETLYANQKLADILGVTLDTIRTTPPMDLFGPGDDVAFIVERLRSRLKQVAAQYELRYPHPDGDHRVLRLSVSPLNDDTRPIGWLVMITNISDERRAEQELRRRALYDELTELPNRSLLTDRLNRALVRTQPGERNSLAVLFIDIDQFKLVNDSWGHDAGDRLLVAVAGRLSGAVKSSDTLARFGGDEFVVIREDVCEAEAEVLAAELLSSLAAPFDLAGQRSYVSASIGIAVSPPSPAKELLRFADAAMHDAKSRGRSRIQLFDVALADHANGQLSLSNDLRDALARDELALFYQPLIELATGRVIGAEALARWDHPTRGRVSPLQFVALAEATGLAPALDRWALGRACRDLAELRAATGPTLRVSVNLSATHFADPDLEHTVLSTLMSHGLECGDLELEITESAIMDNPDYARALLERLRARGMSIAIDDFGTGYSSLGYLSRLPATTVKIDRSFVHNIAEDADSLAIVASIIGLCRTMRLTTIAEGIETREQLRLLQSLGCTAGQGFLWSPALPLAEFGERIGDLGETGFES